MKPAQKVIKYCSMAFAILLMVGILTGITAAVSGISMGISWNGNVKYIDFTKEFNNVTNMDLSNYSGEMYVQRSDVDQFVIKASNVPDTVIAEMNGDTLVVDDKEHSVFNFHFFWDEDSDIKSEITVYVPRDFKGDKIELSNGSGRLEINDMEADVLDIAGSSGSIIMNDLKANELNISSGSGHIEADRVMAQCGDWNGGSGSIRVTSSNLNDFEFKIGSGSLTFDGALTGDSEIKGGSGSATIDLADTIQTYEVDLDEGSGSIYLNGEKYRNGDIENDNAANKLSIDGGSGKISIDFAK